MAEIISERTSIARKEHICNYCRLPIKVGEKYENSFLKGGGEVWRWKNHLNCHKLADELNMWDDAYDDEGLTTDSFCDQIKNYCEDKDFTGKTWEEQMAFAIANCLE